MKSIYKDDNYIVEKCGNEYIVIDRNKCMFIGYNNGYYDLIKKFTKLELEDKFGIRF